MQTTASITASKLIEDYAKLPEFLRELWIRDLRIGQEQVDLVLVRHDTDVGINVLKKTGGVEIVTIK